MLAKTLHWSGRLLTTASLSLLAGFGFAGEAGHLALSVSGKNLVDGAGHVVQLRGVNVSGLEFVAAQGWRPEDPWGGGEPDWSAVKSWKANAVRIPLNEASWLGYKCVDVEGKLHDPDPGHNYQAVVRKAVSAATTAGLYVILDLHWTAPKNYCPLAQNPMADEDNSIAFWKDLANSFKSSPSVAFELFNEPYFYWIAAGESEWGTLRNGGTLSQMVTGDGHKYQISYSWKSAGMQQMLDAVRSTGATNVVLVGGPSWAQDMSKWVEFKPDDPLHQLAAVWHAYPNSDKVGEAKASEPKLGSEAYSWAQRILDANYPVVITEYGDRNTAGTRDAPFVSHLLPWADSAGASYFGWTWDVWQNPANVLIKDREGTPTDGFGGYVRQHMICAASGQTACR